MKRKSRTVPKKEVITNLERCIAALKRSRKKNLTAAELFDIFINNADRT